MSVISMTPSFDFADPKTFLLDLANPKPKEVVAIVEAFAAEIKKNPILGPLLVTTGWNDITPEIAVDLLRRNRPGANRKVDPGTVFNYARQMAKGDWKPTGQPALIDSDEKLIDFQHRALAALISGVTIPSYVVTGIKPIDNLFAYIDNSRSRTAAVALQTAGLNGVSATIVKVLKLAEELRLGVHNPAGPPKPPRLSPVEMLNLAKSYPNAQPASRAAATDWERMVDYVGGKTRRHLIACFAMLVADLHGGEFDLAEAFFDEITDDDDRAKDDPIAALRKKLDDDNKEAKLKPQDVVGVMIKAFNAWRKGESLKGRWVRQVDEDMPVIDPPAEQEEAA